MTKKLKLIAVENISGGLSLCVENKKSTSGERISGSKVYGEKKYTWIVKVDELLKMIENYQWEIEKWLKKSN